MPKTLAQLNAQIERLEKEAETLRSKEVKGVVERIRTAIEHYGLTTEDLFGGRPAARTGKAAGRAAKKPKAGAAKGTRSSLAGKKLPVKFKDDKGNTWTGRGNKPRWLAAAIADGKTLEDFAVA